MKTTYQNTNEIFENIYFKKMSLNVRLYIYIAQCFL